MFVLSHRATDTLTGKSLEELKKKIAELLAQNRIRRQK